MPKFQGAIFDVDGVLVDSPHEKAWRESLRELMESSWRDIRDRTTWSPDAFTSHVYQQYVAGKPRASGARAALDYFHVPDADKRVAEYAQNKQQMVVALIQAGDFTAYPDALRFVIATKDAGMRIADASSSKNAGLFLRQIRLDTFAQEHGISSPTLRPSLTLLDYFDADVSGRDFAHGKPDPEIFLTAAHELGVEPRHAFVIEDASAGVQAAEAGGMAAIGVARADDAGLLAAAHADLVVTTLDDVDTTALSEGRLATRKALRRTTTPPRRHRSVMLWAVTGPHRAHPQQFHPVPGQRLQRHLPGAHQRRTSTHPRQRDESAPRAAGRPVGTTTSQAGTVPTARLPVTEEDHSSERTVVHPPGQLRAAGRPTRTGSLFPARTRPDNTPGQGAHKGAAMTEQRVTVTITDGVADVRLTRPEKRNALDGAMFAGLVTAGERLKSEPGVRAVVLSGEGPDFCAGLDFSWFRAMRDGERLGLQVDLPPGHGPAQAAGQRAAYVWAEIPVPVIAALTGNVLGGGLQIALGADIRIAAPDARMSVLEIRWGLVPDMTGTQLLPELVGRDVAKELTFSGRVVSGEEAVALGLATRVDPDPRKAALELARSVAGRNPHAVRAAKRLLDLAGRVDLETGFAAEQQEIGALIGTPNQAEAVAAEFDRRPPKFTDPG